MGIYAYANDNILTQPNALNCPFWHNRFICMTFNRWSSIGAFICIYLWNLLLLFNCFVHLDLVRKIEGSSSLWTIGSYRLDCNERFRFLFAILCSNKCGAISKNSCSAHDGSRHVWAKHNSQYGRPKWAMHIRRYSVNVVAKNCHLFDCTSSK